MKIFTGTVISNKSANTVRVLVEYQRPHPKYGKLMKQKTKLLAHNLLENVAEGDIVVVETCKPVSKNKFFLVRKIVTKGKIQTNLKNDSKVKDIEKTEEKTVVKEEKEKKAVAKAPEENKKVAKNKSK